MTYDQKEFLANMLRRKATLSEIAPVVEKFGISPFDVYLPVEYECAGQINKKIILSLLKYLFG